MWKSYAIGRLPFLVLVLIVLLSGSLTWDQKSPSIVYHIYSSQNIDEYQPNEYNLAKVNDTSQFEVANTTDNQHECQVNQDLPIVNGLFVGRDNKTLEITEKIEHAHIIGISGAPGFGKSYLAIHFGYEMVKYYAKA